ncbi:MAG: hypothetical protein IT373_27765 [Polyangiaceae bacterium]|nr:hypothetical protein [Polyangiaceae bacterium]
MKSNTTVVSLSAPWGCVLAVALWVCAGGVGVPDQGVRPASRAASRWDPGTGAWTEAPPLSIARSHHTATLLPDGRVLIAGGESPDGDDAAERSWELWGPDAAPGRQGDLAASAGRSAVALTLPDGRAVLLGGRLDAKAPQIWTPDTMRWTGGAPYRRPIGGWEFACAALPDGHVLVTGGAGASLWDTAEDRWANWEAFPFSTSRPQALALADGRMLVVGEGDPEAGGHPPERRSLFLVGAPGGSEWRLAASWPGDGEWHRLAQLASGDVLVLRQDNSAWTSVALWDPTTAILTPMPGPSVDVYNSSLIALDDGRALLVVPPGPLVWSPSDQRWTAVPMPPSPLLGHAAVRLADGGVLVTGGTGPWEHRVDAKHLVGGIFGGVAALALIIAAGAWIRRHRPSSAALTSALAIAFVAGGALYLALAVVSGLGRMG